MAKEQKQCQFVKDVSLSKTGFATYDEAKAWSAGIREADDQRVRVRRRSRTSLWDVVVKRRRAPVEEVAGTPPKTAKG